MHEIGADYMKTVNETIIKVATSPNKKITTAEARTILRNCGILNKNNQIKTVYRAIIINKSRVSDEKN